jgi:hypothetical protein
LVAILWKWRLCTDLQIAVESRNSLRREVAAEGVVEGERWTVERLIALRL